MAPHFLTECTMQLLQTGPWTPTNPISWSDRMRCWPIPTWSRASLVNLSKYPGIHKQEGQLSNIQI